MEQVEALLREKREYVSVDVETVTVENQVPLGIAVGLSAKIGVYFFNPRDPLLREVLDGVDFVVLHNAKFDLPILARQGFFIPRFEDTKILAYSNGILENSLESLSIELLTEPCPSVKDQWLPKIKANIGVDHVKMGGMSIIHACNTYALWELLPKPDLYYEIDKPCISLVMEMESWGVKIDQFKTTEIDHQTTIRVRELEAELARILGPINLNSNPQIVKALQGIGVMGTRKTKTGADSVSEDSLKALNHPVANQILEHRKLMKTINTYIVAFRNVDSRGRVQTRLNYTTTGRWRSGKEEVTK